MKPTFIPPAMNSYRQAHKLPPILHQWISIATAKKLTTKEYVERFCTINNLTHTSKETRHV